MELLTRRVIVAAAFGAGAALIFTLVAAGRAWNESRPRPWNATAVTSEFDSADVEGDGKTLVLSYVLYNHRDRDFRVDDMSGVTLAGRREEQQDLTFASEATIRLDVPVFIPPKERARAVIHLAYPCPGIRLEPDTTAENRKVNRSQVADCLQSEFSNLAGFVLFDDRDRIRIDFPKPR